MTIIVRLPQDLEARLRAELAEDAAMSEFVRQAITEKMDRDNLVPKPAAYEAWQARFAGFESGETDRSERAEDILGAAFDAQHRNR